MNCLTPKLRVHIPYVLLLGFSLTSIASKAQQMDIINHSNCDMLVQILSKNGACDNFTEVAVIPGNSSLSVVVANGDYVTGARVRLDGCSTSPTGQVRDCSNSGCSCSSNYDDTFIAPISCCGAGDTVLVEFTLSGTDGTLIIDMY